MPVASLNGSKIHFLDSANGKREVVLLLHAFPLHAGMWSRQVAAVSARYRVIAPDYPGLGKSEPRPAPSTMDALAQDVLGVLGNLGIDRAAVVGLSMGGYLAFELYRERPGLFRGLALCDTRAGADTPEGAQNREIFAKFAGSHHERLDGRGYPRGLTARDMAMQARIIAIADIFEALGHRSFRALFLGTVIFFVYAGFQGAMRTHLYTFIWKLSAQAIGHIALASLAGAIVGLFFVPWFNGRFDKKWTVVIGVLVSGEFTTGPVVLHLAGWMPTDAAVLEATLAALGFLAALIGVQATVSVASMMGDIADEHELVPTLPPFHH